MRAMITVIISVERRRIEGRGGAARGRARERDGGKGRARYTPRIMSVPKQQRGLATSDSPT